ncbi:hypothetical protein BV20DRAFT_807296 [Pilatotrama ljubarskyi]|nr:hypothetical protein BV20DRAFT_807296 [Pilatotrama ljubarskyi]
MPSREAGACGMPCPQIWRPPEANVGSGSSPAIAQPPEEVMAIRRVASPRVPARGNPDLGYLPAEKDCFRRGAHQLLMDPGVVGALLISVDLIGCADPF